MGKGQAIEWLIDWIKRERALLIPFFPDEHAAALLSRALIACVGIDIWIHVYPGIAG